MSALSIAGASSSEEILPCAKMVHEVVSLPVLEEVLAKNCVIDVVSTIGLASVFSDYPKIVKQVEEQKIQKGLKI